MSQSPISQTARNLAAHIHAHVSLMLTLADPPVKVDRSAYMDHTVEMLALQIELMLTAIKVDALKRQCSTPASSSPSPASYRGNPNVAI